MWYIVYREPFKSVYKKDLENGYYVGYKNKCEDSYSPNWFEAQKYKSLGAALTRLNVNLAPGMDTMEKFISANKIDGKRYNRDITLSKILGDEITTELLFSNGRIEKIDSSGQLLGDASDDVMDYITKEISKNKTINDKKYKKLMGSRYGESSGYIVEEKGEDFWEGF